MRVSDLTGQRFTRLVVTARVGSTPHGNATWACRCDCGTEAVVAGGHLKSGHARSCGCLVREAVAKSGLASRLSHGHASDGGHTRAYSTWHAMKQRCQNPNHRAYEYYGGRGIRVCERWSDFANFLADMGDPPDGKSIDRIDNNGNYEPSNCRWSSVEQQLANRRPYRARRAAPGAELSAT